MSFVRGDLCRLCAAHSDLNENLIEFNSNLSQIIFKYLSITIKNDDEFSTRICHKCEEKVTDFHTFATECERIQSMFEAYKNDNIFDGINHQLIKTEDNVEILIKEEFDDFNNDDNFEECTEFIEPIEIQKTKNSLIKGKRKKARRKRKIIPRKSIINGVGALSKDVIEECIQNEDKTCELDDEIEKEDDFNIIRYKCHKCGIECKDWNSLSLHTSDVHGVNPQIKCVCSKILFTLNTIQSHQTKHDPFRCFICDYCQKTFSSKKGIKTHIYTHLPKNKPYACYKCAKSFPSLYVLKMHEDIHRPREERYIWNCEICKIKFSSKNSLVAHKRIKHEKLRPFMCDLCGYSCSLKNDLKRHRISHSNEKNYICEKCNKRFKTDQTLQRHIDSHADTAYQCPHCPMLLNTRRILKNHLFVHDESANHPCLVCKKAFKTRDYLRSHMKKHTGERPYLCPWCPRTFSNPSNFRIHKRQLHPTELELADKTNPYLRSKDEKKDLPKKIIHTIIKTHPVPLKPSNTTELNELHNIDKKENKKRPNLRSTMKILQHKSA